MAGIYVEENWDGEHEVTDGHGNWLATFLRKDDAEEYADQKRLEP